MDSLKFWLQAIVYYTLTLGYSRFKFFTKSGVMRLSLAIIMTIYTIMFVSALILRSSSLPLIAIVSGIVTCFVGFGIWWTFVDNHMEEEILPYDEKIESDWIPLRSDW